MSAVIGQILEIVGVILQFIAIFFTARHAFYSPERKVEEKSRPQHLQSREEKFEWVITLVFLTVGTVLQVIAIFL